MTTERRTIRCAVYTRKSTEEGLQQEFNSLDAQLEACLAYIASQKSEGWKYTGVRYDDGGFSGGNLERPALARLFADIDQGRVDMVVVYKIDRLTRSLMDFSKLVERLERAKCSFVSVTQSFNTSTSMGRLVLNVLLSFAQFEREVTAERIRDKIAASRKRGIWTGGSLPLGYAGRDRKLVINEPEAHIVRQVFELYLRHRCVRRAQAAASELGLRSRSKTPGESGPVFSRGGLHWLLTNPVYVGEIRHKDKRYPGQHQPIIDRVIWDEVQALLTSNPSGSVRGRRHVAWRSALAGKAFDETGDRLSPSHSGMGQRRRQYYVSHRLLSLGRDRSDTSGWRLPGERFEQDVAARVAGRLTSTSGAIVISSGAGDPRRLTEIRASLSDLAADHQLLLELVESVRIERLALKVDLNRIILAAAIKVAPDDIPIEFLSISAPFQTRRRRHELRMIFDDQPSEIDQNLLRYVAKGWLWWDAIKGGKSLTQLAAEAGVSPRLIANHLPAGMLAPDIVELIVDGRQPTGLTVTRLRHIELPLLWAEQRALLDVGSGSRDAGSAPLFGPAQTLAK